jgi:Cytochrome oxidase complex assembly protein 1
MTTKKAVIIIVSILAALVLLVLLFVGVIVGGILYTVGNSEAASAAKSFLKENATLRRDIGEVKDFGTIVTGNINSEGSNGVATLYIKVIGERKTVNTTVDLAYKGNSSWRVTGASYTPEKGHTVDLLNQDLTTPSPESSDQ